MAPEAQNEVTHEEPQHPASSSRTAQQSREEELGERRKIRRLRRQRNPVLSGTDTKGR